MTEQNREERRVLRWPCGCLEERVETITYDGESVDEETLREEWCPERKALEEEVVRLQQLSSEAHVPPPRPPEVEREHKRRSKDVWDAHGRRAWHLDRGRPKVDRSEAYWDC